MPRAVGGPPSSFQRSIVSPVRRHVWIDAAAEYEEWQAFYAGPARDGDVNLGDVSRGLVRVAREYCKTEPRCGECPLQCLLPPRGPIPLDGD